MVSVENQAGTATVVVDECTRNRHELLPVWWWHLWLILKTLQTFMCLQSGCRVKNPGWLSSCSESRQNFCEMRLALLWHPLKHTHNDNRRVFGCSRRPLWVQREDFPLIGLLPRTEVQERDGFYISITLYVSSVLRGYKCPATDFRVKLGLRMYPLTLRL